MSGESKPKQYGRYFDRHHLAFVFICKVKYLKYVSMEKHFSRFYINKANILLISVDPQFLLGRLLKRLRRFTLVIYKSFGLHIPKTIIKNLAVHWFHIILDVLKSYDWVNHELPKYLNGLTQ
jgi:hypothetical protein